MSESRLKEVRIGPFYYKIARVKNLIDTDDSTRLDGTIKYSPCLIEIDDALCRQKAKQVLLHEIIHALLRHNAVDIENRETICDVLSHGIIQVFFDNELLDTDIEIGELP